MRKIIRRVNYILIIKVRIQSLFSILNLKWILDRFIAFNYLGEDKRETLNFDCLYDLSFQ